MEDRVFEIVVAAAGPLLFILRLHLRGGLSWNGLSTSGWEGLTVGVWVICALVIWHGIRAAVAVSREIKEEAKCPPAPLAYSTLVSDSGAPIPITPKSAIPYFHADLKLAGTALCLIVTAVTASYLMWKQETLHAELPPTSDLRISAATNPPFEVGKAPQITLQLENDSPYIIHARYTFLTATAGEIPARRQALVDGEEKMWAMLQDNFEGESSTGLYVLELPPRVPSTKTFDSSNSNDVRQGSPFLTATQASDLRDRNGETSIFFMMIFEYIDTNNEPRKLEYCTFTQGRELVRCMSGHNGPALVKRPSEFFVF